MKVLVFAYKLVLSGTTVNAVDLAASLRDRHGFEIVVFAEPGPLSELLRNKGLRLVEAPSSSRYPSLSRMLALRRLVKSERPDLIHAWDWPQCIDAYYAVHLPMRIPLAVTDMCMGMTRLLPKRIPTTFGTPELVDLAHRSGRRGVELLLPPIDTESDVAARVDSKSFRHRCGIQPGDFTLVTVSRLDHWLKGDSLFRTMDVVSHLAKEMPVRFVLVGDGTARDALAAKSAAINEKAGREVVVLPGNMIDPRPAYAMADVVIGMGGSALRGMSFGKPVLIVGKGNFCAPLTPETAHSFYYQGVYGHGTESANNDPILNEVRALASDPQRAHRLGCFAREFVCEHFSLEKVSAALASFCTRAAAERESLHSAAIDGLRTGATYLRERRFLQSF